jgi:hypothetical protein
VRSSARATWSCRPRRAATRPRASPDRSQLAGEGLRFRIEPGETTALLLPENAEATSFVVARSEAQRAELEECVTATHALLDQVAREAAGEGTVASGPATGTVAYWREQEREAGPVKDVTILGATPNWADSLGGTLSFVRVARAKETRVFRLYWSGKTLRARGGSAYSNPAPLRLIDFGHDAYGGWNPALGVYVDLTIRRRSDGTREATLEAGDRSVTLTVAER